jgi:hypothetical protein
VSAGVSMSAPGLALTEVQIPLHVSAVIADRIGIDGRFISL